MKRLFFVAAASVVICTFIACAEEEIITRESYIRQVVQLLDMTSELPENAVAIDYAGLLNKKGFNISTENLGAPISQVNEGTTFIIQLPK